MSNFPDFSELGYQGERELGHNRSGGRVTYLAVKTPPLSPSNQGRDEGGVPVVIKQFQFAKSHSSWSDYETYQREIQLLQQLNHPSIPRYIDSFETNAGFCLVQEYKQAPSLAKPRQFTPQEIKQIAIALLEVLVYLQQQTPPIIHGDIKPENILVDENLKVYLVDFGFARTGGAELAASSAVKGTLGFMPPEQLFNRQVTEASDLYSLGVTLICLLTGTKSTELGNLIDENYRLNFKHLVPQLSPQFISWLEKMTALSLCDRYPNAAAALEALQSIKNVVGNATTQAQDIVLRGANLTKQVTFLGLASISFIALLGTTLNLSKMSTTAKRTIPTEAVRQLLENRHCPGCNLKNAQLQGIYLAGANLGGANLVRAELGGANLQDANLGGADLVRADLRGADLRGTDLRGADLKAADLRGADLRAANLLGADMRGAKLKGAKMPDSSIHD
ncbi:pentapeptide repeat-containing protein [Microcoleus sp. FACHB-831]|uniref:serine/threonine protein kinase n=1 Tax=Microcoleus sp. FACHB-831 TaxID=2692827 RepID=UPI0016855A36|nr:serine/threonine-protein kinase [Microcoleus sp. FACHB-831]MBD1923206.1 pentapeptide repeat-containing protein [Microcoleus sp. FACHB-831]